MKSMIWEESKNDKLIAVHEVYFCEPSRVAGKKAEAKRNKEEIDKQEEAERLKKEQEEKALQEAEKAKEEEEREKAYREAYYARWRIIFVCDSLLNDWQVGDETIDEEMVYACKQKSLNGEDTEKLLNIYDIIKDRFIKTFGEADL